MWILLVLGGLYLFAWAFAIGALLVWTVVWVLAGFADMISRRRQ